MDDFGNQGERLQRARAELFQEQKFGEVVQLPIVGDGEHRSEALKVDVLRPHIVMVRHAEVARCI